MAHFQVRLVLHLTTTETCRLGYLYPAKHFTTGEHAERFGMCLWTSQQREAVAVHVFPPVDDRRLAPDGWSIAEPIHVDCTRVPTRDVPAVTVMPAAGAQPCRCRKVRTQKEV